MSIHARPRALIESKHPCRVTLLTGLAEVAKARHDVTHADAVAAFCTMKGVNIIELNLVGTMEL